MPRATASTDQHDMTGDYLAAGSPPPYTTHRAKRAARAAFTYAAPTSTQPWRGYAAVQTSTGARVVYLEITRAKAGRRRIGGVRILGTVQTGR